MLENKKIAVLFSICAILLSTFVSAKFEFNGMQDQLDALYYEEPGLHSDLMALAGNAFNINKIAQRYDIETGSLTDLAERLQNSTPDTAAEIKLELEEVFNAACNELHQADLSEQDEELLVKQEADFKSTLDIISRSSYHETAASITQKISEFPASLLQQITLSQIHIYKEAQ